MELKQIVTLVDKQIVDFEKALYMYENIVKPRAEADKKILASLREQSIKLGTLVNKLESNEQVTREEIEAAVPPQFR